MRTLPIPVWVKAVVDAWTDAAHVTRGPLFRAINKAGRVSGDGLSPKVLLDVVRAVAAHAGVDKLAPRDLRRTCARMCHLAGGELDQIQFLLGHVSIAAHAEEHLVLLHETVRNRGPQYSPETLRRRTRTSLNPEPTFKHVGNQIIVM